MSTPITAAADDYQIRSVAQKLERDRAALMEALDNLTEYPAHSSRYHAAFTKACEVLRSARANFPEQP